PPLIQGSSPPSAKVVAMTASTQSPPAASTSAPTSAALRDCAATMPPLETTAGLRICWALLNWSLMLLSSLSFTFVEERLADLDRCKPSEAAASNEPPG